MQVTPRSTPTASRYIFAALLFLFSASAIVFDAYRQAVPPRSSLDVVERGDIQSAHIGENFGVPLLRDEYVALELRDGRNVRYREWYPRYAQVKDALLSSQPIRVWIATKDHYKAIYQVESAAGFLVTYDLVASRMQRNSTMIVTMAAIMVFIVVPYCSWKAWRVRRKTR